MYVNVYIHKAAVTMNSDERLSARSATPPVSARLDALHENHFGSHERQLQRDVGLYHRRPHMQAIYHCNPKGVKKRRWRLQNTYILHTTTHGQTVTCDIDQRVDDHICSEKRFRQKNSANGWVVQSALEPAHTYYCLERVRGNGSNGNKREWKGTSEPLVGLSVCGALRQAYQVASEAAYPLRSHGIALVSHCTWTWA